MHESASKGDAGGVKKHLKAKGSKWVFARDSQGRTGLHKAAKAGHLEVVKVFLSKSESGSSDAVKATDHNQRTALHYAGLATQRIIFTCFFITGHVWESSITAEPHLMMSFFICCSDVPKPIIGSADQLVRETLWSR